jgi:hypothetical protein
MLMGRVDIKQNQYYQHLALKQRKVTASLLENMNWHFMKKINKK